MKNIFLMIIFALRFLAKTSGSAGPAGLIRFFKRLYEAQPTIVSDDAANAQSSAVFVINFKIVLFAFQLFLSSSCYADVSSWSPISWIQNLFYGKKYEAVQAYKKQDYDQSLAGFHDLMNQDPYNPEYNYNVGNLLYRQKKYSDAKQSFNRAIEHARKSSRLAEQAYFNVGNSCFQLEQWQDAIDAYEHVLQIDEDNESAQHNLQLALYKLKEQQMKDQQQDKNQNKKEQSKDKEKNKDKDQSSNCKDKSQENQSGGDSDDGDQDSQGQSKQDQGQSQKKSGSQNSGQQEDKNDGAGNDRDEQSQEKSTEKGEQQSQESDDEQGAESGSEQSNMNEFEKEGSDSKKSSKNQLQDSGTEKENPDDVAQKFDKTQGAGEDTQAWQEEANKNDDVKKDLPGAHRKPELKNQLQDQYEAKAWQDERLNDYHASVMKTLEDLEEKIQKHIIKNKVAMQGPGQNGKKGW